MHFTYANCIAITKLRINGLMIRKDIVYNMLQDVNKI